MTSDASTTGAGARPSHGFQRLEPSDLTGLTYDAIRQRILSRALGTGEQIPVDAIAADLGVSRTPVIDALKRLAGEGLVEIRARRGCFVRALSPDDIREIFEIREAVELFALRQVIRRERHHQLLPLLAEAQAAMRRCVAGDVYTDYERFIRFDQAFHTAIVAAADNARFLEIYRNLHVHLHIMRSHNFEVLRVASGTVADHQAILDAVGAGDAALAEQAAHEHLAAIRDKMLANLQQDRGHGDR